MTALQLIRDRLALKGKYRSVFGSHDGQIVLQHLARECFLNRSTIIAGEPHLTALNEGSRRVILAILRPLHEPADNLIKKLEEARYENATDA